MRDSGAYCWAVGEDCIILGVGGDGPGTQDDASAGLLQILEYRASKVVGDVMYLLVRRVLLAISIGERLKCIAGDEQLCVQACFEIGDEL